MNTTELLDLFRHEVADREDPQLWSDEEGWAYMDDAQKMFCRLTGGLGDASSAITQLSVSSDSDWVSISPLVLKVRDASNAVTGRGIELVNYEDLRLRGMRFDGRRGPVRYLVLGMEPGRARCYPFPIEPLTVQLVVDRLPLKAITDEDQKFEIAEQHHQHLLLWMKHRAYAKQDAETYDKTKSAEFQMRFENYCADAKAEKDRAMHKTRTVSYGGI